LTEYDVAFSLRLRAREVIAMTNLLAGG